MSYFKLNPLGKISDISVKFNFKEILQSLHSLEQKKLNACPTNISKSKYLFTEKLPMCEQGLRERSKWAKHGKYGHSQKIIIFEIHHCFRDKGASIFPAQVKRVFYFWAEIFHA